MPFNRNTSKADLVKLLRKLGCPNPQKETRQYLYELLLEIYS